MKRGDVVMFLRSRKHDEIMVGAIGVVVGRDPFPDDALHRPWPNNRVGECWIVDDGCPAGTVCDVRPGDVEVLE